MEQEDDTNKNHRLHPSSPSGGGPATPPAALVEKEHMFDKVVTPSDVGKLNRLVIPKQHAERYFPLDVSSGEKGLLLSFEDRNGKPWPFRYSYWNSSQSYVMTKGWSRFVKEKRLDAGDTISFGRGVGESGRHRLFIDWRRRPDQLPTLLGAPRLPLPSGHRHQLVSFTRSPPPANTFLLPSLSHAYCHNAASTGGDGRLLYFQTAMPLPPQAAVQPETMKTGMVLDSVPVMYHKGAAPKRVRLFGVNLDCPEPEGDRGGTAAMRLLTPPLQLQLGAAESSSSSSEQHLSLDLDM